jgi:large subunit ribosomal protein L37Ae
MVAKVEKLGSAKRFGSRYGTKPKYMFAKIEKEQRKKHKCPYCNNITVKRISMGIWHCRKCNAKFTGKAYTITKDMNPEKVQEQETLEEVQEVEAEEEEKGSEENQEAN